MLACNKLENIRRRANRARNFPVNTCPASRHVRLMAEAIASGRGYSMFETDPELCAAAMFSVLESLWKARTKLATLEKKAPNGQGNGPRE